MMEDVFEPLAEYRDRFREAFAENAKALFERLVAESGVDAKANADTVRELSRLEKAKAGLEKRLLHWRLGAAALWIGVVTGVLLAVWQFVAVREGDGGIAPLLLWLALVAGSVFSALSRVHPRMRALKAEISDSEARCKTKRDEGWQQMAPLNALFDWDLVAQLTEQTVPRIVMDRRFHRGRLRELRECFGWNDGFNHDKSIVDVQSGEINGNPFVLASVLERSDGTRTYTGHLDISWREYVSNNNGEGHWETKHERLTASVTKFCPVYSGHRYLIYGCEAAPDLSFSRKPRLLSGMKDNAVTRFFKNRSLRHLERKAEKLGAGDFTVMANEEFDVLFHAVDRDNEQQFRLLFTPLAQQQMVALLKDKEVGFGDDFTFGKKRKINVVTAQHLDAANLDTDPAGYAHYDLKMVRSRFLSFANEYFKAFYFAMAPLLAIPLYQQTRTHEDFRKTDEDRRPCFWEFEALANFEGEKLFEHPDSATRSILRAGDVTPGRDANDCTVDVTACSYKGIPRLTHVTKRGRDDCDHEVPVEWIEYIPIERTVSMAVAERADLKLPDFRALVAENAALRDVVFNSGLSSPDRHFRRNLVAFVSPSSDAWRASLCPVPIPEPAAPHA
ncbi:MAG: hypothetical protein IJS32_03540 [Kiritimatiellae bacterium]|nr:hypothetical protein [Kiritimatiellia bacterium]